MAFVALGCKPWHFKWHLWHWVASHGILIASRGNVSGIILQAMAMQVVLYCKPWQCKWYNIASHGISNGICDFGLQALEFVALDCNKLQFEMVFEMTFEMAFEMHLK
jgi:hypothetical protein